MQSHIKKLYSSPEEAHRIAIYGSFYPPKLKEKLGILKEFLIDQGYLAGFVEDWFGHDKPRVYEKCERCLQGSNSNILCVLAGGSGFGFGYEINYILSNPMLWEKSLFLIEADDRKNQDKYIGEVIRSREEWMDNKLRKWYFEDGDLEMARHLAEKFVLNRLLAERFNK